MPGVALRRDPHAEIRRVDPVRLRRVVEARRRVVARAVAAAGGGGIGDEHLVAALVVADERDVVIDGAALRIERRTPAADHVGDEPVAGVDAGDEVLLERVLLRLRRRIGRQIRLRVRRDVEVVVERATHEPDVVGAVGRRAHVAAELLLRR